MTSSPFFTDGLIRICGARFPLLGRVGSGTNVPNPALLRPTRSSPVLGQKALHHDAGDRQEDTEQPGVVCYLSLKCKRAHLRGNRRPLVHVPRWLMAPLPRTQSSTLLFTLPDVGSFDWDGMGTCCPLFWSGSTPGCRVPLLRIAFPPDRREQLGLKVIRNPPAFCSASSTIDRG